MVVDRKILKFIDKHHLLSLATIDEDGAPYCASIFYAFQSGVDGDDGGLFAFSTDSETRHGVNFIRDQRVAATIALETSVVGKIQGLQIVGRVVEGEASDRRCYIAKYPYAAAIPSLKVWRLEVEMYKLTDNRLGFGKKLIWKRE